jgi:hypothetical protein
MMMAVVEDHHRNRVALTVAGAAAQQRREIDQRQNLPAITHHLASGGLLDLRLGKLLEARNQRQRHRDALGTARAA